MSSRAKVVGLACAGLLVSLWAGALDGCPCGCRGDFKVVGW